MWFMAGMLGLWLVVSVIEIRKRVGHYPGDEVALLSWGLSRALTHGVLAWVWVWAVIAFAQFVLEGGFFYWLARQ